jgi:hypothetical protein
MNRYRDPTQAAAVIVIISTVDSGVAKSSRAGRGKATYKTYIQVIHNYLIPLLGNHNVDRIDNAVLARFEAERIELMGRVPSASVINNHNSALNSVFDEAIERGYMTKFQLPLPRNDGVKTKNSIMHSSDQFRFAEPLLF